MRSILAPRLAFGQRGRPSLGPLEPALEVPCSPSLDLPLPLHPQKFDRTAFMPAFWCVNLDSDDHVLAHGLEGSCWLMQYQYSHDGHAYQGGGNQIAATSRNRNVLKRIKRGDWLVAYQKRNQSFGIGTLTEPRPRNRHRGQPHHEDTIRRAVREYTHRFLSGVVRYTDAPA
jgi:hypothetical protein